MTKNKTSIIKTVQADENEYTISNLIIKVEELKDKISSLIIDNAELKDKIIELESQLFKVA